MAVFVPHDMQTMSKTRSKSLWGQVQSCELPCSPSYIDHTVSLEMVSN